MSGKGCLFQKARTSLRWNNWPLNLQNTHFFNVVKLQFISFFSEICIHQFLFHLTAYSPSSSETQDKNRRQKPGGRNHTEAETMGECCLLASSPCFAQPAFLYISGPPAQGRCHPQQAGPFHLIINQDYTLQTCLHVVCWEAFFQLKFLFPDNSDLCLVNKKVNKQQQNQETKQKQQNLPPPGPRITKPNLRQQQLWYTESIIGSPTGRASTWSHLCPSSFQSAFWDSGTPQVLWTAWDSLSLVLGSGYLIYAVLRDRISRVRGTGPGCLPRAGNPEVCVPQESVFASTAWIPSPSVLSLTVPVLPLRQTVFVGGRKERRKWSRFMEEWETISQLSRAGHRLLFILPGQISQFRLGRLIPVWLVRLVQNL